MAAIHEYATREEVLMGAYLIAGKEGYEWDSDEMKKMIGDIMAELDARAAARAANKAQNTNE